MDIERIQFHIPDKFKALGAIVLSTFAGVSLIQAEANIEKYHDGKVRLDAPLTWLSAPVSDAIQNIGGPYGIPPHLEQEK